MQKLPIIILVFGVAITTVSIMAWLTCPLLLDFFPQGYQNLKANWNSSQLDMVHYFKIYLFNVTNPQDVISGGKPDVQEAGPYVYAGNFTRIISDKTSEEPEMLRYKDQEQYFFRPDLTTGSEDDIVSIVNVPFAGFAQEVSTFSSLTRVMVMGVVTRFNEGLFLTKTVHQLLFGGFRHELLATFSSITGERYMPNNTFGLFYGRNNSNRGDFLVSTGFKDEETRGKISTWNNMNKLKWWDNDACSKIDGSFDGTLFPPGITQDTILSLFDPSVCRTFKYGFKEETSFHGILGYRFTLLRTELEDPRTRPENMCYCTSPGDNSTNCPKDGSFQMNACSKGASVSLSMPHFLHGSQEYLDQINGFHPDEALHEPYIDIEPKSGLLLQMAKRSQVNMHIKPLRLFKDFRKVRSMLFPTIWVEETKEISPEVFGKIRGSSQILGMFSLVGLIVGIILIFVSLGIIFVRSRKNRTKYNP